jgi:hypothetical protein
VSSPAPSRSSVRARSRWSSVTWSLPPEPSAESSAARRGSSRMNAGLTPRCHRPSRCTTRRLAPEAGLGRSRAVAPVVRIEHVTDSATGDFPAPRGDTASPTTLRQRSRGSAPRQAMARGRREGDPGSRRICTLPPGRSSRFWASYPRARLGRHGREVERPDRQRDAAAAVAFDEPGPVADHSGPLADRHPPAAPDRDDDHGLDEAA